METKTRKKRHPGLHDAITRIQEPMWLDVHEPPLTKYRKDILINEYLGSYKHPGTKIMKAW